MKVPTYLLSEFLKFVDDYTYSVDGVRHHRVDNMPLTNDELAFIFLDSDMTEFTYS